VPCALNLISTILFQNMSFCCWFINIFTSSINCGIIFYVNSLMFRCQANGFNTCTTFIVPNL
jgi:hypothetical protein